VATTLFFDGSESNKKVYTDTLREIKSYVNTIYSVTRLTQPPTREAATIGFALMDDMGLDKPLGGFVNEVQKYTFLLDQFNRYSGKVDLKVIHPFYKGVAYQENVAKDLSVIFQFLNDDMMKGNFVPGWKPTERTRSEGLAQTIALEMGMGANAEVKVKVGDDDGLNLTMAGSLESRASFGATFPLHKQASTYLHNLNQEQASVSPAELAEASRDVGSDPYGIGASQNWDKVEDSQLSNKLARGDVLTLPAFVAIQAR
jgi:hypothetical protein